MPAGKGETDILERLFWMPLYPIRERVFQNVPCLGTRVPGGALAGGSEPTPPQAPTNASKAVRATVAHASGPAPAVCIPRRP